MSYEIVPKDELYHYGVKGMKWGKHIKAKFEEEQNLRNEKKKKQQEYNRTKDNTKESKNKLLSFQKTDRAYEGYNDAPANREADKQSAADRYLNSVKKLQESKTKADEAYKKYSSTTLGKVESTLNKAGDKVSSFVNKLLGKSKNSGSELKDRISTIKATSYAVNVKKNNR